MPPEYKSVIADTSCFILLDKINAWSLLQSLFNQVITTDEIATEYGKKLPDWISIQSVTDKRYLYVLRFEVDIGEASAIALAVELQPSLLIVDDLKARKLAAKLHLNYTGTLGIFLKAKKQNHIEKVKPYLDKIQATNFRLSTKVYNEVLAFANE